MRSTVITTTANRAGGVLLLALLLASCGDADSGDGSRPTISTSISPTRTPTAEVPSTSEPTSGVPTVEPTEPAEPTTEPTSEEPPPELPSPTRTPERTERPDNPETTLTSEPSEPEPAPETDESEPAPAPETATVSPEAQEPETEPVEDGGVPNWVWVLAAALVLGCLVAIPLVVRARRRTAWRQDLASAEGELAWLARELLPELRRAGSREEVAGGWSVSQARVSAVEDRLTVLESSAPDDAGRARALVLRDASRAARAQMQRLLGPGPHDTWALDLDTVITDLESALRPPPVTSPG
jgi:hypothetical protein